MLFKHLDWMLVKAYFKAYAIFLVSLLTLYIVIDLFTHLDDFAQGSKGLAATASGIGAYYGYRLPELFDRLCEVISLLAAMFTVVMMQRNSEHLPLLSAGVPTWRIVAPVLACACAMLLLAVANQEVLVPRLIDKLLLERSDMDGSKEVTARGAYELNKVHIKGERASRKDRKVVKELQVLLPDSVAGKLVHFVAAEAEYFPGERLGEGRWELSGCQPRKLEPVEGILEVPDEGRATLRTSTVDFDMLTRNPRWFSLSSTYRLYQELQRPESNRASALAVQFHMRLTRPLTGLVLVFLGLSLILRDQTRNIVISSGQCILLCGLFFVVCQACKMLGDDDILAPSLAAWLPVLAFGPFAVVQFDAIQT
ncbi:MAG: LptF/LptG family permease [Gemmataceae bacterium]|nr:LptF/LptG family permease [Gemmataceae bacterium]